MKENLEDIKVMIRISIEKMTYSAWPPDIRFYKRFIYTVREAFLSKDYSDSNHFIAVGYAWFINIGRLLITVFIRRRKYERE